MFAALALLSTAGILNFYLLSAIERALLKDWHESATPRP
jgi:ABC-type nitrate/sulfonate/bicarbonate transport system permease component